MLLPALGIFIAALTKGPASAMVLGGVVVGACIAARSARPLAGTRFWVALLLGAAVTAIIGLKVLIANNDPNAVREDVAAGFLWSRNRIVGVLTLMPVAFASALPASLGLLVVFMQNRRGHAGAAGGADQQRAHDPFGPGVTAGVLNGPVARALAWSWLIAVGVLVLAGIGNARYAMPAAVLLPPLVPHAMTVLCSRIAGGGWFAERVLFLGAPRNWALVIVLGAWWFVILTAIAPAEDQKAGVAAAEAI